MAEPTNMSISYGTTVSCALEVSADSDVFRFVGTAGDSIVINSQSSVRPCVELVAPDNSRTTACENAFSNRIDMRLTQTGQYAIQLSSVFAFTGGYTLVLERVQPSLGAVPLAYGASVVGDIDPEGDIDLFSFDGTAGDSISLSSNSSIRPCLELLAPDGTRTVACENAFTNRIDAVLTSTGPYTLLVSSVFAFTGEFSLAVQCLLGPCVPQATSTTSTSSASTTITTTSTSSTTTATIAGVCHEPDLCSVLVCDGTPSPSCVVPVPKASQTVVVTVVAVPASVCRVAVVRVTAPRGERASEQRRRDDKTEFDKRKRRKLSRVFRGSIDETGRLEVALKLNKVGKRLLKPKKNGKSREVDANVLVEVTGADGRPRLLERLIRLVRP